MNPVPAIQANSPKEVTRRVMCGKYNQCLCTAMKSAWQGFTCRECRDYELEGGGDPSYWDVQNWRAAEILVQIITAGS